MEIRLPYPPSVNNYWRTRIAKTQTGLHTPITYVSAKGKAFRNEVAELLSGSANGAMEGRLQVAIELTMPDRRRRDIDNPLKAILDALEFAGVYKNDSQIDSLIVRRVGIEKPGCADVVIEPIP